MTERRGIHLPTTDAAHRAVPGDPRGDLWERRFSIPTFVAAMLVIPTLFIEESNLASPWPLVAGVLNWVIWGVFVAQVVLMLAIVKQRRQWLRSHVLEVLIVVLTPPFLPASLQSARLLRLLRLLRVAITARSLMRFFSLNGLRLASLVAVFGVLGAGALFAAVEVDQHLSTWDGVWWAIGTVTTAGSEIYPHTTAGRMVAIVIVLIGIGYVAILTGSLTQLFVRAMHTEMDITADLGRRVDHLADEISQLRADLRGGQALDTSADVSLMGSAAVPHPSQHDLG